MWWAAAKLLARPASTSQAAATFTPGMEPKARAWAAAMPPVPRMSNFIVNSLSVTCFARFVQLAAALHDRLERLFDRHIGRVVDGGPGGRRVVGPMHGV